MHQTTNLERGCGLIWACRFVRGGRELQSFRLLKSKRGAANDRIASPLNRPRMGNQVWTNSRFLSRNLPACLPCLRIQRNATQCNASLGISAKEYTIISDGRRKFVGLNQSLSNKYVLGLVPSYIVATFKSFGGPILMRGDYMNNIWWDNPWNFTQVFLSFFLSFLKNYTLYSMIYMLSNHGKKIIFILITETPSKIKIIIHNS